MQPQASERPTSSRILVVDDDQALLNTLETILSGEGFPVEAAEDGAVGLARAREQTPALVLLDLHMPIMNGYAFLDALRAIPACASVPVILMSGSQDPAAARRRVGTQGVVLLLRKPFDLGTLLAAVRGVVRAPEPPGRYAT